MLNTTKNLTNELTIYSLLFSILIVLTCFPAYSSPKNPPVTCNEVDYIGAELEDLYPRIKSYYIDEKEVCSKMHLLQESLNLPSVNFDNFEYVGGFRIPFNTLNDSNDPYQSLDFSYGIITYNPLSDSIFISGNPRMGSIAELAIPEIKNTDNFEDFNIAEQIIQPLKVFYKQSDPGSIELTGIERYFRITGLGLVGNSLIVNYINWYDAEGTESDTTIVFKTASQINSSELSGPYQLEGGAHSAGWISEIPRTWKPFFNGSHMFGNQAEASINSRLSLGPTAFSIYPRIDLLKKQQGEVTAQRLLDFPMPDILHESDVYSMPEDLAKALRNEDLNNRMWTNLSGTSYGFIVPGSRTYITLGRTGGHESGIGYKIIQNNGNQCAGQCPYDHEDMYSYYWAWDVLDLIKVRYGALQAHQVRPTAHGKLNLPFEMSSLISGGTFDFINNRLFLSFKNGDTIGRYSRPPLILAFKLKPLRCDYETAVNFSHNSCL